MSDTKTKKPANSSTEAIILLQDLQKTEKISVLFNNAKKIKSGFDMLVQNLMAKAQTEKIEQKPVEKVESVQPAQTVVATQNPSNDQPNQVSNDQKPSFNQQQRPFERRPYDSNRTNDANRPFDPNRPKPTFENTRSRQFDVNAPRKPFPRKEGGFQPGGFQPRPSFAPGQKPAFGPRPFSKPVVAELPVDLKSRQGLKKRVDKEHENKTYEDDRKKNKRTLIMRGYVDENVGEDDDVVVTRRRRRPIKEAAPVFIAPKVEKAVITSENITVKMLAEKIGKPVTEIIAKFLLLGMMVNINSTIDFASAELISNELGVALEQKIDKTFEEKMSDIHDTEIDDEKNLKIRPPVVTVMGHVDHGKTSLLDKIRNTHVTTGEFGGITQRIGAYTISMKGQQITFIDTPGHAAFAAMRERGSKIMDVAILVVAADDGVMPQTIEAIKYIKSAKVPMIVAVNKIDKQTSNIERIKQQLAENNVLPEEWGGDAILVPVSALSGQGIDKLLEMVLFVAEYQNLKANPNRKAKGIVVEAELDKGKGTVASVLVQNGTLKVGDVIVAGTATGKVRAMTNDKGANIKSAGPSIAASIIGLSSVPKAGDSFYVVDEKLSRQVVSERKDTQKKGMIKSAEFSVDALMNKMKEVDYKYLNVIIKGDVQGSVEALQNSLIQIQNEEVKVKCIHLGVGAVNENDATLASVSNAVIVAFNVKVDFKAKVIADKSKIEILNSKIIYEVIDRITKIVNSMITPKYKEVVTGHAEVRMLFKSSKVGVIAGSMILDGKISRSAKARVLRKEKVVFEGAITSIQREKNEVKEISSGFECGITITGFSEFQVGDIIESFVLERTN